MNAVLDRTEQEARRAELFANCLDSATAEIIDVFCNQIRVKPAASLTVISEGAGQVRPMKLTHAIDMAFGYPATDAAVLAVLQKSNCPHVEAWRRAMAAQHIEDHAEDIADIMAGSAA